MKLPIAIATILSLFALSAAAQTTITVDPGDAPPPPPVTTEITSVDAVPSGRSAVGVVAVDSVYGGLAGGVIGGGVTLIDQGHYWGRDLMVGAGVGVLIGAGYGIFEVATAPRVPVRAMADRDPALSDPLGVAPVQYAIRF
jgi:hypothetical protein